MNHFRYWNRRDYAGQTTTYRSVSLNRQQEQIATLRAAVHHYEMSTLGAFILDTEVFLINPLTFREFTSYKFIPFSLLQLSRLFFQRCYDAAYLSQVRWLHSSPQQRGKSLLENHKVAENNSLVLAEVVA